MWFKLKKCFISSLTAVEMNILSIFWHCHHPSSLKFGGVGKWFIAQELSCQRIWNGFESRHSSPWLSEVLHQCETGSHTESPISSLRLLEEKHILKVIFFPFFREKGRDLPFGDSFPKWPQCPGLGQGKLGTGTPSTLVAGFQRLVLAYIVFAGAFAGSLIGSETARTGTSPQMGCWHCRQKLNLPHHCANHKNRILNWA